MRSEGSRRLYNKKRYKNGKCLVYDIELLGVSKQFLIQLIFKYNISVERAITTSASPRVRSPLRVCVIL